ncbi:MAG TPA: winged helix-turn-helix domain-containing protein [Actinomycetes bacterium]|jgi:DNA-binding transcriptional ArsR family regulator|nr:winged helix-turn-helix domain-containing protein [Actinomycetes bacterium]
MVDPRPDYQLDESVHLTSPAQFEALANPLRHRILVLLLERAATISQLAQALGCLKGSVSHHLKVLEAAGLVRIVRTRRVRGGTERYYGRTSRRLELDAADELGRPDLLLNLVAGELATRPRPPDPVETIQLRHLRLTQEQAQALTRRLLEVADDTRPAGGDQPLYGLLLGVYRTGLPSLPGEPPRERR